MPSGEKVNRRETLPRAGSSVRPDSRWIAPPGFPHGHRREQVPRGGVPLTDDPSRIGSQ